MNNQHEAPEFEAESRMIREQYVTLAEELKRKRSTGPL